MKKLISRVCCLCFLVLVLAACLPFSAFAVDPVSAGVMANAFAQAIAAYGASNGVAMTFDVTSTDGIGETMHELWSDFRAGTQDADDYATLAAALFPDLYYKASSVVAGASDVYTVGYNISSTYAEEFDNFFDWLLSGPAEMVKVDNAYYQFSQAQIGPESSPLLLVNIPVGTWSAQPLPIYSGISTSGFLTSLKVNTTYNGGNGPIQWGVYNTDPNVDVYAFLVNGQSRVYVMRRGVNETITCCLTNAASASTISKSNAGAYYTWGSAVLTYLPAVDSSNPMWLLPIFDSVEAARTSLNAYLADPVDEYDTLGVKASTNTGVAQFPDTTDPNYEAVGKQIPSTVPWDNTAYGDGTGTLTDAQAGAIAAGADTAIARDGVLDLAGTDEVTDEPGVDDPPTTDPDDYAVPGLAEIFPFCIPFDIYNFLSALAANPVAPHFTATLDFPEAVGGTQTIDIDFDSPTWNQLAQLLRLLELLAFIIGLALLTRSMFIRG